MFCIKCGALNIGFSGYCHCCGYPHNIPGDSLSGLFLHTYQLCYLSTPEHLKTLFGKLIYLYVDHGCLVLNSKALVYSGRKYSFSIPYKDIASIRISHFPRYAKPIRLDYVEIKFNANGLERTLLFTPSKSFFTPVWESNRIVKQCFDIICQFSAADNAIINF